MIYFRNFFIRTIHESSQSKSRYENTFQHKALQVSELFVRDSHAPFIA